MTSDEKEQIRARTDIVELISRYTALKKVGNRYKGLCPFHTEKTPSFTVNLEMGRFHCFGCSASGDVFTFLERIENLTFLEAAERLALQAGIELTQSGNPEEAKQAQSERDRIFAVNALAQRFFREGYKRATLAQEYAEGRGFLHQTREDFGIGYAPDDWSQLANFLLKQKIHSEDAIRAGLITASSRKRVSANSGWREGDSEFIDRFRGRLMFPIVDVQERVIGFGGRLIVPKTDAPKYLNSPETPVFTKGKTLYALNRARKAIAEQDVAVLVEGYTDVIAAHQAGIPFVVATLGTALTDEHIRLLRRYTKNIVLSFDADTAGIRAALRAAELIAGSDAGGYPQRVGGDGAGMTLKVLALPQGEDPDSLIRKGQAAVFRRAIDEAVTVPEFRLRALENVHDVRTEEGRMALLKEAIPIIAGIVSLLDRDLLIRRVAAFHPLFRVSGLKAEQSVRAEVDRAVMKQGGNGTAIEITPTNGVSPGYNNVPNAGRNHAGYPQNSVGNSPGRRQRYDFVPTPPPLLSDLVPAAEVAERTLLRAALTPQWLPTVARILSTLSEPLFYVNPMTEPLMVSALSSLVGAGNEPQHSGNRGSLSGVNDPELLAFADTLLLDDTGPQLSEAAIEDAVAELKKQQIRWKNEQIRAEIARKGEGTEDTDDEKLRQYMLRQKALRGR